MDPLAIAFVHDENRWALAELRSNEADGVDKIVVVLVRGVDGGIGEVRVFVLNALQSLQVLLCLHLDGLIFLSCMEENHIHIVIVALEFLQNVASVGVVHAFSHCDGHEEHHEQGLHYCLNNFITNIFSELFLIQ